MHGTKFFHTNIKFVHVFANIFLRCGKKLLAFHIFVIGVLAHLDIKLHALLCTVKTVDKISVQPHQLLCIHVSILFISTICVKLYEIDLFG